MIIVITIVVVTVYLMTNENNIKLHVMSVMSLS